MPGTLYTLYRDHVAVTVCAAEMTEAELRDLRALAFAISDTSTVARLDAEAARRREILGGSRE